MRPNVITTAKGSCYLEIGKTKLTYGTGKIGKTKEMFIVELICYPLLLKNVAPFNAKLRQEALETVVML